MNSANELPKYGPEKFMGKTNALLEAKIMYAGIELGIFNSLTSPMTIDALAENLEYHSRNLELLLNALVAIELIEKDGSHYQNKPETAYFLNSKSEMYLGDHILYWSQMTSLDRLVESVKKGPQAKTYQDDKGADFFDFKAMSLGAKTAAYLGRVQSFMKMIHQLELPSTPFKVMDMGGGSGVLSIELAKAYPRANCLVMDQPNVLENTKAFIGENNLNHQITTLSGNFTVDALGGPYKVFIASGVLDFVGDIYEMACKIYDSLEDDGYLYVSTHGINPEFTGPKPYILGWLSSQLDGLDILKADEDIRSSLKKAGFEIVLEDESKQNYILKKLEVNK